MALRRARQRRAASITSLIDVIFLLLLFFMLASTFTKRAEIELMTGAGGAAADERPPVLRLLVAAERLTLDGRPVATADLSSAIERSEPAPGTILAVDVTADADTQRLTDVLLALRAAEGVTIRVLEPEEP